MLRRNCLVKRVFEGQIEGKGREEEVEDVVSYRMISRKRRDNGN